MNTVATRQEAALEPGRVLAKAVVKAARLLDVTNTQLAEVLGVSQASVSRIASGQREIPAGGKERQLALLFLRMFRSLDALVGGHKDKAQAWLHARNAHLGDVPAARIADVQGLVEVVQYLDAMRGRI